MDSSTVCGDRPNQVGLPTAQMAAAPTFAQQVQAGEIHMFKGQFVLIDEIVQHELGWRYFMCRNIDNGELMKVNVHELDIDIVTAVTSSG